MCRLLHAHVAKQHVPEAYELAADLCLFAFHIHCNVFLCSVLINESSFSIITFECLENGDDT